MSRTIQAASDAMNARIQATNDMNAAAAQQMQLDQNLAIMPLQQKLIALLSDVQARLPNSTGVPAPAFIRARRGK
jgi:hypothetical protein